MDNLAAHKVAGVRDAIEAFGRLTEQGLELGEGVLDQ